MVKILMTESTEELLGLWLEQNEGAKFSLRGMNEPKNRSVEDMALANAGYSSYGSLIQTSDKVVGEKPDVVRRFVDASIEGWYSYLYGDPAPANELIKRDNPEMTDALLAYGIAKIKEHGIVDSGDAKTYGIGQ